MTAPYPKKSANGWTSDVAFNERRKAFEEATDNMTFTKDFNSSLFAIMHDPLETVIARVLAWIKRNSWGRQSLHCILENGKLAYQVDCCNELKLDKRRVSAAVSYLVRRGYVVMDGKVLIPVISPVLAAPPEGRKSPEWGTFLEEWKVAHSADFEALEVARSEVKRLSKVLLSDYKRWRAPETNAGPSLLKEGKEVFKEEPPPTSQPISPASEPEEEPAGWPVEWEEEDSPETLKPGDTVTIPAVNLVNPPGPKEVREEVKAYLESIPRPGLTPQIVDSVAEVITTPEALEAFKVETMPAKVERGQSWMYFLAIAKRVALDAPRYANAKANGGNGHSPPEPKSRSQLRAEAFAREVEKARGR